MVGAAACSDGGDEGAPPPSEPGHPTAPCTGGSNLDADGDGVCDSADVCPGDDTLDADTDGTPDDCDPCPADPLDDSDGDTVCDSADVCAGDDTVDTDTDGAADDCDVCPVDPLDDSDGDTVCDSADVCVGDDTVDTDTDGFPDACDACAGDPTDLDADAVSDVEELAAGTDPGDADSDGDHLPDGGELGLGLDPRVPWIACSPWTSTSIGSFDGVTSVAVADLDGDTHADVLVAAENADVVAWFAGTGLGTFGAANTLSGAVDGAKAAIAADLDGDGDLDVASASDVDDTIAWFRNLGAGTFSGRLVLTTLADGARAVQAGDLDGDGDVDLLGVSETDSTAFWLRNDGGGAFDPTRRIVTSTATSAYDADLADLDGDGDLDLLLASSGDDTVRWYTNDGLGTFTTESPVSTSVNASRSAIAVDLDGDGDLDTLTSAGLGDTVAWYENLGLGQWGAEIVLISGADSANAAVALDYDLDGDLDVAASSFNDDRVQLVQNLGDGAFASPIVLTSTADGIRGVAVGDLDEDGAPDLVGALFAGDSVASLRSPGTWGDPDADGLTSEAETCAVGSDPDVADSDGGGVPDGVELQLGLDPGDGADDPTTGLGRAPDTDGDGRQDDCDDCPADPEDADTDRDGACDDVDLCPGGDDASDADGDGAPDACDPCPLDDPDDGDGDGACDSETDGSLVLVHQADSWLATEGVELHGLFAVDLQGLSAAATCWPTGQGPCLRALPSPDAFVDLSTTSVDPTGFTWIDVGATVALGRYSATAETDPLTGSPYWYGLDTVWTPDQAIGAGLSGGAWGDYAGLADGSTPDTIAVTSPDPLEQVHLVPGGTLDLAWVPGGAGDVVLVVDAPGAQRLYRLTDDGAFSLPVDDLALDAVEDQATFFLGRWTTSVVIVAGNRLEIVARSEQVLSGRLAELAGRTEIPVATSCAGASSPIPSGAYWGDLSGAPATVDPGPTGCTGHAELGPEGLLRVELAPGERLTASYDLLDADGAVYLLSDCALVSSCVTGADDGGVDYAEVLTWHNETASTQSLTLVVDSYAATGDGLFTLDLDVSPVSITLFPGDCASAEAAAPAGAGAYTTELDAAGADLDGASCGAPGREVVVPVEVGPYQELTVSAGSPDVVLSVLSDCADVDACLAGAAADQDVAWTNRTDAPVTVFVVVDEVAVDAIPQPFDVELGLAAVPVQTFDDDCGGAPVAAGWYRGDLTGAADDLAGCGSIADGGDVVVPIVVPAGEVLRATVDSPDASVSVRSDCADPGTCSPDGVYVNAGPTDVTVSVVVDSTAASPVGAFTLELSLLAGASEVDGRAYTPSGAGCAETAALPDLAPGSAWGAWSTAELDAPCAPFGADTQETRLPVHLAPGETLVATYGAVGDTGVIYLLADCADDLSCLAVADGESLGQPAVLRYANATSAPFDGTLVLDTRGAAVAGDLWTLDLQVEPPTPFGDACADAVPLGGGSFVGGLAGLADDLAPAADTCTPWVEDGPDAFTVVTVAPGELLTATVEPPEVHLYALDSCADPAGCTPGTGTRALRFNDGAAPIDVLVAVDSEASAPADVFALALAVMPAPELVGRLEEQPLATCADAELAEVLAPGASWGSTAGLFDLLDPSCVGPSGAGGLYPVELAPGERLDVDVDLLGGVGSIAVLTDCAVEGSCVAGADLVGAGSVGWTNGSAALVRVWLSVESTSAGPFLLDLSIDDTAATADTCSEAQTLASTTGPVVWLGDTTGLADDLDPGVAGCTGAAVPGPELLAPVHLEPFDLLRVEPSLGVAYLVSDCADASTCEASGHLLTQGGGDALFTLNALGARDVFVALDSTGAASTVTADVDLGPAAEVFPAEACTALPAALTTGTTRAYGDLSAHVDDLDPGAGSCAAYGAAGGDGVLPVALQPGETVEVDYVAEASDGALYLLTTCGDVGTCVAGDDDFSGTAPFAAQESITWTNAGGAPVTVFLVLDGFVDPGPFLLLVDIR